VTGSQLKSLLTVSAPTSIGNVSAPPANNEASSSATLNVNGNDPAQWQEGTPWQDNLGALFTHDGQSETIYSTSTIDVTVSGTSTIDYWAVIPSSQQVLHASRDVVISPTANDNVPVATNDAWTTQPAANDNSPLAPLAATGTDATSSPQ
jgi:hypothetical protein